MHKETLALRLRQIYIAAGRADTAVSVILFGIRYAEVITASGIRPRELARLAEIPESYASQLQKGIRLSRYVTVRA